MLNQRNIIGLLETDAIKKLKENGINYRVIYKNGQHYMITCDVLMDRWNLSINNSIVVDISFG